VGASVAGRLPLARRAGHARELLVATLIWTHADTPQGRRRALRTLAMTTGERTEAALDVLRNERLTIADLRTAYLAFSHHLSAARVRRTCHPLLYFAGYRRGGPGVQPLISTTRCRSATGVLRGIQPTIGVEPGVAALRQLGRGAGRRARGAGTGEMDWSVAACASAHPAGGADPATAGSAAASPVVNKPAGR